MAMVAGRFEKMLSWTCNTWRAMSGLETATMWRKPMRRWSRPPYFSASLAKPRWVSWSIMSMLPMIGRPLGPGGYGFRRRRERRPRKMSDGIMKRMSMEKGWRDCMMG